MKISSIVAVSLLARAASAIPAYFVTVSCPDVATVTVYPPGWGPLNGAVPSYGVVTGGPGGVTTSWTTLYETTTTYCPAPGVYPPPKGVSTSLTAYMATTFTYTLSMPTGYVFNTNEYLCTTCAKSVIVIRVIETTVVIVGTEFWVPGASTTNIQNVGSSTTYSSIVSGLTPPWNSAAGNYGSVGAPVVPATASYPQGTGAYPSVQFSDSKLFPPPTIDFKIVSTSYAFPTSKPDTTFTVSIGPNGYGGNYPSVPLSDTKLFTPPTIDFKIVSTSFVFPTTKPDTTFSVSIGPNGYGGNYPSISNFQEKFTPSSIPGFSIVSLEATPATAPPAALSSAPPAAPPVSSYGNRYGANYPSVNMANFFSTTPTGAPLVAPASATVPVAETVAAPPATTEAPAGRYGAGYPSVNFASAFTAIPQGPGISVNIPGASSSRR